LAIITRERIAFYCVAILLAALAIGIFSALRRGEIGGDFAAFYAEGKVALKYPAADLYNVELQDREYSLLLGSKQSSPVAFAPWFTILLAGLAQLPYHLALTLWTIVSLTCLILGYRLATRSLGQYDSGDYLGVLVCLAFPPYLFYTFLNGQPAAFGFFLLALTYFLQKRGALFAGGLVLSLLSFKPTLIVFLGPMLLLTRQWKLFLGLITGVAVLGLISLWWAGIAGIKGYLQLLNMYSQAVNSPTEVFQTYKYVDIGAALRLLFGPHGNVRLVLLSLILPVILFVWYRLGPHPVSWALAVICGVLLNFYSPIYDCTLLIFAVLIVGVDTISEWLLIALYLVPLITVGVAKLTGLQLYTLVLIILFIELLLRASPSFRYTRRT
jgi:glycosyl transferase family 87